MSQPDDEDLAPLEPSALDTIVQDHPIAALVGAILIGALLARFAF